ncbi:hypothetical protein ACFFX0_25990 [Citricoccus parietis]|uniref:Uncharacterized protein n=1 Tax=Citricoccus parietis TaxID=592307 RepID=A0ABV5G678_9MICC
MASPARRLPKGKSVSAKTCQTPKPAPSRTGAMKFASSSGKGMRPLVFLRVAKWALRMGRTSLRSSTNTFPGVILESVQRVHA